MYLSDFFRTLSEFLTCWGMSLTTGSFEQNSRETSNLKNVIIVAIYNPLKITKSHRKETELGKLLARDVRDFENVFF